MVAERNTEAETQSLHERTARSDLPIEELGLPTRVVNLLKGAGFATAGEIQAALETNDGRLTHLKGLGPKSLAELRERLAECGLLAPATAVSSSHPPASTHTQPQVATATTTATAGEASEAEPTPTIAAPEGKLPPERIPSLETQTAPVAPARRLPKKSSAGFSQPAVFRVPGGTRLLAIPLGILGLALILVALFLPPLSLLERLQGYSRLDALSPAVSHPDGITLRVDPASFTGQLKVKLFSVPRLEFLEGSAGAALRKAAEALPENLIAKSPLYRIQARGRSSQPVMIDVVVPNDAEPWHTLDLYTWNGETWVWVGSELHTEIAEQEFIRATVTELPTTILVVQNAPTVSAVSTYLETGDAPVSTAGGLVDEVNPVGLLLGTLGGFAGELNDLPRPDVAAVRVIPTLRNWKPGGNVNRGLLADLLASPELQQAHIANILQLCLQQGFAGVELDYRGVESNEREAFTTFVRDLAEALHAQGLQLNVVLDAPTTDAWETGGYDWNALGAVVDEVKVRFPSDPTAYVNDGLAEQLLDRAKSLVPRTKLRMVVPALSVDSGDDTTRYMSLEEALAPFGQVVALQNTQQVTPGTALEFVLSGTLISVTPLEESGTYRIDYKAEDSQTRTIWIGTAANLASKLKWAAEYRLGGAAVEGLLHPGNAAEILSAITAYRAQASAPNSALEVQWMVEGNGQIVDQRTTPLVTPRYTWTAPNAPGTYKVSASIAGFDRGSVAVNVIAPESAVVTSTAETTSTTAVTATEAASVCLNASYVADVTIPDNTRLKNGEEFTKTWRVRNSGQCAWPADTVLAFVSGAQMGAPATVEVGALEPGQQKDISVRMKAPDQPGRYIGTWRMRTKEGLFGGSLTVVILAGEQANVPTVAPVSGGPFELGGHILDNSYPYASRMHYAGMTWSKVQVRYDPGNNAAGIIQAAHANGFKIQLSALGAPNLVTQPNFENDFAAWVASMAAAGADAIEIWNEPNIEREWQAGYISPAAYTRLLCASYRAIKAANPNTAVISAAPAPTGWFGGCSPAGCDDLPWLIGLRDAGAANCMDYIGAHHNAGATSPSARSGHPADNGGRHHSWYFLPQTELYYNIFGGTRKLFYTEMGYASQEGVPPFSDAFAWARGTTNAQQAQWLAEAVQLSINTGMVRCIIVWNIDFKRAGYDPQDGYAIIRPDGSCPACEALHAVLGTR